MQSSYLLPNGFYDLLPEQAIHQHHLLHQTLDCFMSYGYQLVEPPLVEFEETLFQKKGEVLKNHTFRVHDSMSPNMMGVRTDMTMQVARIALSRLQGSSLPLRLTYAGPVLRTSSSSPYKERQLLQAGIELIGIRHIHADAEVILAGLDALSQTNVENISVDFSLPRLTSYFLSTLSLPEDTIPRIRKLINRKEIQELEKYSDPALDSIITLLSAGNDPDTILSLLSKGDYPQDIRDICKNLSDVIDIVKTARPDITLTIDALEHDGFEYYSSIGFSFFSSRASVELGRGGHYTLEDGTEAVGLSLQLNHILHNTDYTPPEEKRILLLPDATYEQSTALRKDGWVTLHAFSTEDSNEEAIAKQCSAIFTKGKVKEL